MALADIGRKALGITIGIIVIPAALLVQAAYFLVSVEKDERARYGWLVAFVMASLITFFVCIMLAYFGIILIALSPLWVIGKGYYSFAEKMREKNYGLFSTAIATLTLGSVVALGLLLYAAVIFVVTPLFFIPFQCMRVAEREGVKAALMLPVTLWERLGVDKTGALWVPMFHPVTPDGRRVVPAMTSEQAWEHVREQIALAQSSEATLEDREAAQESLLRTLAVLQHPGSRVRLLEMILPIRDPDTGASPQVIVLGLPLILARMAQPQVAETAEAKHQRCEAEKTAWKQESKAFNAIIDAAEASRISQPRALTEGELNQFEAKILPTLSPEEMKSQKSQCDFYRGEMTCPITAELAEYPVTVLLPIPNQKNNESKEEVPSKKGEKESKEEIPYKVYERVKLKEWIEQYIGGGVKPDLPARYIPEPTARADLNTLDILFSYPKSFEDFVCSVRKALTPAVEKTEQPVESPRALTQASVIPHSIFQKPSANPSPKASSIKASSYESPAP